MDLYCRRKPRELSHADNEIVMLGNLLGRTPNAVYMKLCNFLSLDPKYEGEGLRHGSAVDQEVWNSFANRPDQLSKEVAAARRRLEKDKS